MNEPINLGNVVGMIRSLTPPANKPYLIWGKIIDPTKPMIVELRLYKGTGSAALESNWLPINNTLVDTIAWSKITGRPNIFKELVLKDNILIAIGDKGVMSEIKVEELWNSININFLEVFLEAES